MINQSVNEFYTRLLFKIDALPQDVVFPLDITVTLFESFSPYIRELFISEIFQVPSRIPTGTNHQVNQKLILVINAAVEAENNIMEIKVPVQPASGTQHPRKLLVTLGVNPSIQMYDLVSSLQAE